MAAGRVRVSVVGMAAELRLGPWLHIGRSRSAGPYDVPCRGVGVPGDQPAADRQAAPCGDPARAEIAAAVKDVAAPVTQAGEPKVVRESARRDALKALS